MLPVHQFTGFIEHNHLFTKGDKILAAVSGGMDSVVMVHLFKAAGCNFGIAHCNFQLRGDESDRDLHFCKQLARQLDVPFHTVSFDTSTYAAENKISIQMAARRLRYQWFETIRQGSDYAVIALAHHQNDAIETILLNLTRGTGIAGLHGILPKNGNLVRPLLFLDREEITAIADEHQYPFVEDSSNASVKYARNKLRHEVIPKLKELNPALEQTFERNLQHFRDLEQLLETKLAEIKEKVFIAADDGIRLKLDEVKKLEPKRLLLFNLLQPYGFNETAIDDLISCLNKQSGKIFESNTHKLILDRDQLILALKAVNQQDALKIVINDNEISFGDYKLTVLHRDSALIVKNNPMVLSVDEALLIYPLTLRHWEKGDLFYPFGMQARKKVSDFFIGQKVPLNKKSEVPLLVNGDGNIIWVGGYRPDDRFKVTQSTKKVTIFELIKV